MLRFSRFVDLWMIHISVVSTFLIFSFLLQLPISSSVFQIIKELCSSAYSFHYPYSGIHAVPSNVVYCIYFHGVVIAPNARRPFKICCAPPNLGITRT